MIPVPDETQLLEALSRLFGESARIVPASDPDLQPAISALREISSGASDEPDGWIGIHCDPVSARAAVMQLGIAPDHSYRTASQSAELLTLALAQLLEGPAAANTRTALTLDFRTYAQCHESNAGRATGHLRYTVTFGPPANRLACLVTFDARKRRRGRLATRAAGSL